MGMYPPTGFGCVRSGKGLPGPWRSAKRGGWPVNGVWCEPSVMIEWAWDIAHPFVALLPRAAPQQRRVMHGRVSFDAVGRCERRKDARALERGHAACPRPSD